MVTDERLEQIRKAHYAIGSACAKCGLDWPCPPAYLLARLDEMYQTIRNYGRRFGVDPKEVNDHFREYSALRAQVAQMRGTLGKAEAHLSLLRYRRRSAIWAYPENPGIPTEQEVDETIAQARAALSSSPASQRWEAAMKVVEAAARYLDAERDVVEFNNLNREKGGTLGPFAPPPAAEKQRLREAIKIWWAALGTDEGASKK